MKTRGEINLNLAKNTVMNRAGSGEYYTQMQLQSEGIAECMIEWNNKSSFAKKLVNRFKGWRGNYEHTAYIQVCE